MTFPKFSDEEILRRADEEDAAGSVTACNPRFLRPPFVNAVGVLERVVVGGAELEADRLQRAG